MKTDRDHYYRSGDSEGLNPGTQWEMGMEGRIENGEES